MNKKPSSVAVKPLPCELDVVTLERLERIAKLRRSSVSDVMEELVVAQLPKWEVRYGITPDAPAKAKPSSRAKPSAKSKKL